MTLLAFHFCLELTTGVGGCCGSADEMLYFKLWLCVSVGVLLRIGSFELPGHFNHKAEPVLVKVCSFFVQLQSFLTCIPCINLKLEELVKAAKLDQNASVVSSYDNSPF